MKRKRKMWIVILAVIAVLLGLLIWFIRTPYFTRVVFGISDRIRDRGLETPEGIVRIDDQKYGDDQMQVYDVYYPEGTEGPLPTIVSIHGGGYTYGTKEVYQYYCMDLALRGFTVVNFSYRLAPQNRYPAPIEDTNRLMTCVLTRAEELHIDPNNIFFVGDSAGGQLNAQYSAAVSNPEYAALLKLDIPEFTLRATALNCGVYRKEDIVSSLSYYLEDSSDADSLDFLPYVTDSYPPSFVMSATGDMCLPFAEPMAAYLTECGVENELHIYGNETEKPPHVFHVNIKNPAATVCNSEECAFFRDHIG